MFYIYVEILFKKLCIENKKRPVQTQTVSGITLSHVNAFFIYCDRKEYPNNIGMGQLVSIYEPE